MSLSGQAPFTVHVHALDSSLGAGNIGTARYEWDFGDPNGQYNKIEGWNAAHVYDQPGNYTITLRLTNETGAQAVATRQVTVSAPNRTTIYVSPTGNDSNPGTSESAPIRTAARAAQLIGNNTHIRFRRNATYDLSGTINFSRQNVVIGAYGSGSRPVLRWTSSGNYASIISTGPQSRDVVIEDIKFDSPFTPNNAIVRGVRPGGSNITVRNCDFGNVSYAINSEQGVDGLLVLNNTAGAIGAYLVWGQGSNHAYIGNVVTNSTHEHNIRIGGVQRLLVYGNDLTNHSKSTLWCMLGQHAYVAKNTFRQGRFIAGPNFAVGSSSERFRWLVFENNQIINEGVILYAGAEDITLRNNIIRNNGGEAFSVWGYYSPMNRTCKNISILNNTAINNSSSHGRFLKLGRDAENVRLINNMYVAPSFNTNNGGGNVVTDDSDLNTYSFRHNLWANPYSGSRHHFMNGQGLTPQQWASYSQTENENYRSMTNSDLNGEYLPQFNAAMGVKIPGVFTDFYGNLRPSTGPWSVGAVEQEPVDPGNPGPVNVDINGDGVVDVDDLLEVIAAWGPCESACPADVVSDGIVDVEDLLVVVEGGD